MAVDATYMNLLPSQLLTNRYLQNHFLFLLSSLQPQSFHGFLYMFLLSLQGNHQIQSATTSSSIELWLHLQYPDGFTFASSTSSNAWISLVPVPILLLWSKQGRQWSHLQSPPPEKTFKRFHLWINLSPTSPQEQNLSTAFSSQPRDSLPVSASTIWNRPSPCTTCN